MSRQRAELLAAPRAPLLAAPRAPLLAAPRAPLLAALRSPLLTALRAPLPLPLLICLFLGASAPTALAAAHWSQTYGGPGTYDEPLALREMPDGTIWIGGVTDSYGTQSGDAWRILIDANGAVLEEKVYGNPIQGGAADIAFEPDGAMVVVGSHMIDLFTDRDAWIHKVDADGNLTWARNFDAPGLHFFYTVATVSTGGYIAGGSTALDSSPPIYAWVVRLDEAGNVVWQRRYHGGVAEHANFVIETSDGGFAVAGWTTSSGAGSTDLWLMKLTASGAIVWQKTYGGFDQEEATGLIQTADGGFALSAFTNTYAGSGHGPWVLRLDGNGNLLWHVVMGDAWGDFRDIMQTADGHLVATGRLSNPSSNDLWVVKLRDSDGAVLWQRTYEGTEGDWGAQTIELADLDLLIGGIWGWGFPSEDIWIQRTGANGVISDCDLISATAAHPESPQISVQPALAISSNPEPVPGPIAFVTDVSALTVDEKCRATTGAGDDAPGPQPSGVSLSVRPNPIRGTATISLRLDEAARVRVEVHDASGRRLPTIAETSLPAGAHEVQWTDVERSIPCAGVYFVSVVRDGRLAARRPIVVQ